MDNEQASEVIDLGIHEDRLRWYNDLLDAYVTKNYSDIRYSYEEMLRETDEYHGPLSEVDDGWDEFVEETFEEAEGIKKPGVKKIDTLDF